MARRPGDLFLQRWETGQELPGTSDLRRFTLLDTKTGETAELVELKAQSRLQAGNDERFARSALTDPPHPAILPRRAVRGPEGTALIQAPTNGGIGDGEPRWTAEEALAVARWLGPALLEPTFPPVANLEPDDIVLDARNIPRLAPSGIPPENNPLGRSHFVAPEAAGGGIATPASGLYGLGVILFRKVTGVWPHPKGPSLSEAPLQASAVEPGVPEALDQLLLSLLDPQGDRRVRAIRALEPWSGEPPVLSPTVTETREVPLASVARSPVQPRSLVTSRQPIRGRWLVIAFPEDAAPSSRFMLAARANLSLDTVDGAAARKQGIVLSGHGARDDAQRMVEQLSLHGVRAQVSASHRTGKGLLWFLAAFSLLAAGVTAGALMVLALAFAALGTGLAILAATRPPAAIWDGPMPTRHGDPEVAELQVRVAMLLARMLDLPLSSNMASDFRADLVEMDDRIRELGNQRIQLSGTLERLNETKLRKDLALAHQAGRIDQADLLRSAVRQMDEIRGHLQVLDRELSQTRRVLDEIDGTLAAATVTSAGAPPRVDALERISRRLEVVRTTEAEIAADADKSAIPPRQPVGG